MQEAACILVTMKTMTPGLEIELKKIIEINAVTKTLVIGQRDSVVTTIASNFKVVECNPYYSARDRVSNADKLEAGARAYEKMMEESLREWLQGKIELPHPTMSQGVVSQGSHSFIRYRDQLVPLITEPPILGPPMKFPSISMSRVLVMTLQKIGHRLWPRG